MAMSLSGTPAPAPSKSASNLPDEALKLIPGCFDTGSDSRLNMASVWPGAPMPMRIYVCD
jgi:hypothetical protein